MKTLFDTVDQLEHTMTFHRERQSVLAGNVANVDTPGYRPMDLKPLDAGAPSAGSLPLAKTDGGADLSAPGTSSLGAVAFDDAGANAGADGNAVNLERELAKIDANRVRYSAASELVSRRLALLRYAAGDGSGG